MSVSRRNTRRGRNKDKFEEPYSIIASVKMLGIAFANDISVIRDTNESFSVNPTVTIKGNNVIFDYGHLTTQDDIDSLTYLFQNILSVDDTVTVSDATHIDPNHSSKESDLAGTYTFKAFDPTNKIVILNKVSINDESSIYERYDYKYFTNSDTLKFTTESTQTKTEERRIILNLLGAESENSFLQGFRELHVGDLLSVQGVKGDFTVLGYLRNNKGYEEITVAEPVSDADLFGTPTLVTLKRRVVENDSSAQKLFYPPEETDDDTSSDETDSKRTNTLDRPSLINNNTQARTPPTRREPIIESPRPTGTTFRNIRETRNVSKIEQRKEDWLDGSRENIYVKVLKESANGTHSHVFLIKGKITDYKWSRNLGPDQTLTPGETYRFVQTDRSNKGHPLRFSLTPDGTHNKTISKPNLLTGNAVSTNKAPGSSSSYVYFTMPYIDYGAPLFLYCANHPGMGLGLYTGQDITQRMYEGPGITADLPRGPGQGEGQKKDINTCCTEACIECVLNGIREKESGDPCETGPSGIPEDGPVYCPTCLEDPCDGGGDYSSPCYGCNAIKKCDGCPKCPPGPTGGNQPCCRNDIGPKVPCWSCGPYMIKKQYHAEAKRACKYNKDCCKLGDWEKELCKECKGTAAEILACCKRKRDISRLIIRCWWRFYTRNGDCQSGDGPCNYPNRDGKCWTCKNLAEGHNGGPCRNANDDYWPCETDTSDPPDGIMDRCGIKKALCHMGGECDDCCTIVAKCRGTNPPLLTPKDKSCCTTGCGGGTVTPGGGPPAPGGAGGDGTPGQPSSDMRKYYS